MGAIVLNGATSGSTTIQPTDAVTVTLTTPSTSGTIAVSGTSPSFTSITTTADSTIHGLTVGQGGGSASTNTAVGASALAGSNTGIRITALGFQALNSNTTGSYALAVGSLSLFNNTTGDRNTAVGDASLYTNTTGVYNVAVGFSALLGNTTGGANTTVGYQALYSNTTASNNTAVGYQALYSCTTGAPNTVVGRQSGYSVTTGTDNVFLGNQAGYGSSPTTTGSANIYIGSATGGSSATNNYEIAIGFNINGKGSSTGFINPNSGGVYQGNNSSSWSTTSDQRLKKNIVDNTVGLDAINQVRVRNFEYRTEDEVTDLPKQNAVNITGTQLGVIAQELQQVLPDCVKQESTGVLSVDTSNITWHLINAVKELSAELNALKAKVGA